MQIRTIRTNDTRPWTEHIARNRGVESSKGEYIFLIDIDYIIPKETIEKALDFNGDRMPIKRRFGVLDENGNILNDYKTIKSWGVKDRWLRKDYIPGHRSQFLMRKDLFWQLGGYNEALDGKWFFTGGAGERFWRQWQRLERKGGVSMSENTLDVFMFPFGKFCESKDRENPFGLFHNLKRI